MIFEFEFVRIKHICECTNDWLSFDIEEGKSDFVFNDKLVEAIEHQINFFEVNRFEPPFTDCAYKDFNNKISECIELLRDKIELTRCGKNSDKRVTFDAEKYKEKVAKAEKDEII